MDEYFKTLKKYNDWENGAFDLGFHRESYTQKLLEYTNNKLIKVLVGQRRTGKSYILRQIAHQLIKSGVSPKNIVYINREFIEFDFLKDYTQLNQLIEHYKNTIQPDGRVYLFIDEIQNIDGWERFVNSKAQDFTENIEIFITGSNSRMLSGELATLLSGRYVNFEILPFGYQEFLGITQKQRSKKSYIEYMEGGALPEMFLLPNRETKRNYAASVIDTVLLRDIIQRYAVNNPKLLEDIFTFLINNTSNLVSINNIVNYFKSKNRKTSYDTVANYISYIEEAFLIHKVERYDIRGKDTISGVNKYYANDLAYKNYLYPAFLHGMGYQLENLVYLELRRAGFEIFTGSISTKEVDFVAKKGDKTLYVQSAYTLADSKTSEREYGALEKIKDNYEKVVVSMDDVQLPNNQGIEHIQAWELDQWLKGK